MDFRRSASASFNANDRLAFRDAVGRENTTVRLGPNVELDFSGLGGDFFPIRFGRCARLMSVSEFEPEPVVGLGRPALSAGGPRSPVGERPAHDLHGLAAALSPEGGSGRTPRSPGPALYFGVRPPRDHRAPPRAFLQANCATGELRDGVRISGIRVFGPSFGPQTTDETGIHVADCVGVEISNCEIAGWGGAAIGVDSPGSRIVDYQQVKIVGNFLHHNQHPTLNDHAAGYGVALGDHASVFIAENVFDFNRHAITAGGNSFGYDAKRNLVLKGGGWHRGYLNDWTHQFDVHGNAHTFWPSVWCWLKDIVEDCKHASSYDKGDAGHQFMIEANAFQYRKDNAIKIRGRPRLGARIQYNVFPHDGLEGDAGDDAIALQTQENVDLGPGNIIETDTFGEYHSECDFDGDGIDDLFLATGTTWWYSSAGKFHWSYLNSSSMRTRDVRFGYFDADDRCDVLAESGGSGRWVVSSGGSAEWKPLELAWGSQPVAGAWKPLKGVAFGRFDPNDSSARRQTTHAFYRREDGTWHLKRLSQPTSTWEHVGGSSFPMEQLRFGDFTGDGVTDVLAVERDRWAYSKGARETWQPLNRSLGDPLPGLVIANMDADDSIDDILRIEVHYDRVENRALRLQVIWWRSKNGVDRWREFKRHSFTYQPGDVSVNWNQSIGTRIGFAGRFGATGRGGTLVIDRRRIGHFYSPAGAAFGGPAEWTSVFPY